MDNSIYIMLSRQTAVFRNMEVTANNIANLNTPGYNAERLVFNDFLIPDVDGKNAYTNDPTSYRDTTNGSMKTTGNQFDLAINGQGYFQVQTPLGIRYTRAGHFQIDAEGTLVNPDGYPVLGADGGQITIPENAKSVSINGAGQIAVDGEEVGQVGVMEFANEQAMVRYGNSLYSAEEEPQPSETARIAQGTLEMSNVSGVKEMTRVIELSRAVGSTAKFIEVMYDLQRKTSSVYARAQQG